MIVCASYACHISDCSCVDNAPEDVHHACRFDSFLAYAREESAMLEGVCHAGEILFVPRGVCIHGRHQHIKKVSAAHILLLLTSCVLCCRVVAPCCQPGGRSHTVAAVHTCNSCTWAAKYVVQITRPVPAGHHCYHAELRVSSQPAECVATSAKPSTGLRVQPCGACHAARSLCGSSATAKAGGAKCAPCETLCTEHEAPTSDSQRASCSQVLAKMTEMQAATKRKAAEQARLSTLFAAVPAEQHTGSGRRQSKRQRPVAPVSAMDSGSNASSASGFSFGFAISGK